MNGSDMALLAVGGFLALMFRSSLSTSTSEHVNAEGVTDSQAQREADRVAEQEKRNADRAAWDAQQQQSQKDGVY